MDLAFHALADPIRHRNVEVVCQCFYFRLRGFLVTGGVATSACPHPRCTVMGGVEQLVLLCISGRGV